jgi:uptake hydrogenase small subunit
MDSERTTAKPTLLWMACGGCSGESMAILGAEGRGRRGDTLPGFLDEYDVDLLWHPSLSLESPRQAAALIEGIVAGEQPLTILCVEGSIINGPGGSGGFDMFEGRPKRDVVAELCDRADYVLAMGSCAAYGGIPAAAPNPSESTGLQYTNSKPGGLLTPEWRSRAGIPVVNLSACPVDATTMIETMSSVLDGRDLELDKVGRPQTQKPCLSDPGERKCRTADKVGYACYGCIGPKFPLPRPLFRHREPPPEEELPLAA